MNITQRHNGSTEGSGADKIDSEKLTKLEASFTNNEYLISEGQTDMLAPVLWQIQKMQEELDELRRYLISDVGDGATGATGPAGRDGTNGTNGTTPTMTSLSGSSLPTRAPTRGSGLLWNDRGTVKIG